MSAPSTEEQAKSHPEPVQDSGSPSHSSTTQSVNEVSLHGLTLSDSASSLPSRLSQNSLGGSRTPLTIPDMEEEGSPAMASADGNGKLSTSAPVPSDTITEPPPQEGGQEQSPQKSPEMGYMEMPVPSPVVASPSLGPHTDTPAGPVLNGPGRPPMENNPSHPPPEVPKHIIPIGPHPPPPPGPYNGPVPPQPQWGYPGVPHPNGYPSPRPPGHGQSMPMPMPMPMPGQPGPQHLMPPQGIYQQPMNRSGPLPMPMPRPPPPNGWRHSFHAGMVADGAYMPDSSLLAASTAGRPVKQSPFPPPTKENLKKFRAEAKKSNDPQVQLDFAKFLLEAIPQICSKIRDPKQAHKIKEALTEEAQTIVKRLASQSGLGKSGYAEAQFFLASCYGNGTMGLEKDPEKAFGLYMQGSKQNHPGCSYRVAVCYEVGAGTKRDKAHAIQYYRKAANLGDPSAMYKLGMILIKGLLGQHSNPAEGISWLKRATLQGDDDHPHAFHELGLAYEKEGIPTVIPDADYARDLFTHAAQIGYAPSQFKLGLAYENGFLNCPVDPRRSIAWYSKAAEQGHLEAELALSGWYLTGAEGILPQSDKEAYLWARKAADKGYAKAEYAVGYYTETGIGVQPNLEEAKKWYLRAAAQNNKRAIRRLVELKKAGATRRPQRRQQHTRAPNGKPDSEDGDCVIM